MFSGLREVIAKSNNKKDSLHKYHGLIPRGILRTTQGPFFGSIDARLDDTVRNKVLRLIGEIARDQL